MTLSLHDLELIRDMVQCSVGGIVVGLLALGLQLRAARAARRADGRFGRLLRLDGAAPP